MNINFSIRINLFKPRRKKNIDYQPSAPPEYEKRISIQMTLSWCVGGKHKSKTKNQNIYEKVNTRTKKVAKFIKGICNTCGRSKSQIFTK